MKILICDDEHQYNNILKKHLDTYMKCHYTKYEVDIVSDPKIVLDNEIVYNLAFLDIQMNEVDGISLDKILKDRIIATRSQEWAKIHLQNFEKNKKDFELPTQEEHAIIINNF